MSQYRRYAVYYSPPPGPFADFGATWLGWDLADGREVAQPALDGLDLPALTAAPRRYGFHATLKAPFRLASGVEADDLVAAVVRLAERLAPVTLPGLKLARLGSFLALIPDENILPLSQLAAAIVSELDPLRVPLSKTERARRDPDRLSVRQRAYLDRWGYPYVFDDFHFHMTLSGACSRSDLDRAEQALAPFLNAVPRPLQIASICIVGEDDAGRFHLLTRCALRADAPVHDVVTPSNG